MRQVGHLQKYTNMRGQQNVKISLSSLTPYAGKIIEDYLCGFKALPLLPLWTFLACYRVTFTFTFTYQLPITNLFILYNEPINAQLIDKLLHCSYMFRHYRVIFRDLVISNC